MTIETLQKNVDAWIKEYGVRYFHPLTNMAILTEEVGELARILSRKYGEQSAKETEDLSNEKLADELTDVLWVLTCIDNQTGCKLTEAFQRNMKKKSERDAQRHLQNPKLKQ